MGLMIRRRRPIAGLAAGAATAGVASHAGRPRAEPGQDDEQATAAYTAAQSPPPPQYVAPPPAATGGEVDELSRLAQMHRSGALADDEFAAAKAQLLGIWDAREDPAMPTTASARAGVLRRLLDAAAPGDRNAMAELVTDDVVAWSPNLHARSRDDPFSAIEVQIKALDQIGDKAIAEWHVAADHTGPLVVGDDLAIGPTGRRLHLSGATIAEFDGHRVCAFRSYFDDLALVEQALAD